MSWTTWLYTLGVARFAVQHLGTFDGRPIQTWVYPQDRDAGFHDLAVPTRQVLEFYDDRIGPFAYEKLANVQSNSVRGGMESATTIFYDDDSVTGTRSERWREVVIHEIAHNWDNENPLWSQWLSLSGWRQRSDGTWTSNSTATFYGGGAANPMEDFAWSVEAYYLQRQGLLNATTATSMATKLSLICHFVRRVSQ